MTGRVRVKICGLTRLEDAELAAELGADALGFIFWPKSPRAVDADRVRAISRALPAMPLRVGVFVDAPPDDVAVVAARAGLDAIQLHGGESVDVYESLGLRILRVVSVADEADAKAATALPAHVTPLVDAVDPVRRGGTGTTVDWTRAATVARQRPIVLAGGLTPENVGEAIARVRPWGVDVASGVESSPGVKSADRLRAFFASVRAAGEDE
jgi:phosphoribosylanthranilate isomerase